MRMTGLRWAGALALGLMMAGASAHANDISNSTWTESDAGNVSAPPNGWPSGTMTPSQVEPAARAMMGAIKRFYNRINAVKTSAGTANVQTLTYDVAPAAYATGDAFAFIVGAGLTNTGSATLNVNSLGAKTIKRGTSTLVAGDLTAGRVAVVYYDGTDFQLLASNAAPATQCSDLTDDGTGCSANAANPTATIGTSAVNGVATTYMRSDAAPAAPSASTSTAGIAKLHNVPIAVGWPAALNPNSIVLANINQASTITAIIGVPEVAVGSAATVSVYKAGSGVACGSGTVLHSGSFNANGTAATNQSLTVTTSAVAAGDRICLQTTGGANWTAGSGVGTITVFLAPS